MEEALTRDFDYCNLPVMTYAFRNLAGGKVPQGHFVFDTGADVHVSTDASKFNPNDPFHRCRREANACRGRFIVMLGQILTAATFTVGLISSHVLSKLSLT